MSLLIIDGDCGICRLLATWLQDRARRPVALLANRDARLPAAVRAAGRAAVLRWDGRLQRGSGALLGACADLAWPGCLLACLLVVPQVMREPVYAWFARHRSRLSPACGLQTTRPIIRTSLPPTTPEGPGSAA